MTEPDAIPEALIEGLRADYDPNGHLHDDRSVEVRVNYSEVVDYRFEPDEIDDPDERAELAEKYEPGEYIDSDYLNGAYGRLRFDVDEEGTARLSEFKDASPSDGNWIDVGFLRVAHGAMESVENVPGVERVESITHTLNNHIQDGKNPDVRRA